MTCRNPRDRRREAAERANRESREHVEFGEPAWTSDPLHEKLARLAIERLEVAMIAGRHGDLGRGGQIEARFIVEEDDMG